jgi:S-adenosylmethionine:tRNA ribosyltransferase-isomerase
VERSDVNGTVQRGETLDFTLPPELEAHEPPEARGLRRDGVRLLVGRAAPWEVSDHPFTDLPDLLDPGDVLVVNTSGTLPAAVDLLGGLVVHVSTRQPDGDWIVELRAPDGTRAKSTQPFTGGTAGQRLPMVGGGVVTLLRRYTPRLWVARLDTGTHDSVPAYLLAHGRPIRYGYVGRDWPLASYGTVFATVPGSAEMPSASRPFTTDLVTRLASRGVILAPITLHTGVASPEAHEPPYPERFEVPAASARVVNCARAAGSRIVAVGTTAVRAIETAAAPDGTVSAASGWTDLVVTPQRGVRVVDGLLTGFHEPRASHLWMLEAVVGADLLAACYAAAIQRRYLWHEFGDVNLLLAR